MATLDITSYNAAVDNMFPDNNVGAINEAAMRSGFKTLASMLVSQVAAISGWAPVTVPMPYGNAIVLKVADWVGGQGDKPATGSYLSATGLTTDPALAQNIRGAAGPAGMPGTGQIFTIASPVDGLSNPRYFKIGELAAPTGGTYDFVRIELTIKCWDNGGDFSDGQITRAYIANRSSVVFKFTLDGTRTATDGLLAVKLSDGRLFLYVVASNNFRAVSWRVLDSANFAADTTASPLSAIATGTTVGDTRTTGGSFPSQHLQLEAHNYFYAPNISGSMPNRFTQLGGSAYLALGANQISGQGDLAIVNSNRASGLGNGISFWQQLSNSTLKMLMYMHETGNVGINHTAPTYRLDVYDNTQSEGIIGQFQGSNTNGAKLQIHQAGTAIWKMGMGAGSPDFSFYSWNGGTPSEIMRLGGGMTVQIGAPAPAANGIDRLQVAGSISGQAATKNTGTTPTAAMLPAGQWRLYKDTADGSVRLWYNDGGAMRNVQLT